MMVDVRLNFFDGFVRVRPVFKKTIRVGDRQRSLGMPHKGATNGSCNTGAIENLWPKLYQHLDADGRHHVVSRHSVVSDDDDSVSAPISAYKINFGPATQFARASTRRLMIRAGTGIGFDISFDDPRSPAASSLRFVKTSHQIGRSVRRKFRDDVLHGFWNAHRIFLDLTENTDLLEARLGCQSRIEAAASIASKS